MNRNQSKDNRPLSGSFIVKVLPDLPDCLDLYNGLGKTPYQVIESVGFLLGDDFSAVALVPCSLPKELMLS